MQEATLQSPVLPQKQVYSLEIIESTVLPASPAVLDDAFGGSRNHRGQLSNIVSIASARKLNRSRLVVAAVSKVNSINGTEVRGSRRAFERLSAL
jgi:hypothetical protein